MPLSALGGGAILGTLLAAVPSVEGMVCVSTVTDDVNTSPCAPQPRGLLGDALVLRCFPLELAVFLLVCSL